jgi:hypothetical protein
MHVFSSLVTRFIIHFLYPKDSTQASACGNEWIDEGAYEIPIEVYEIRIENPARGRGLSHYQSLMRHKQENVSFYLNAATHRDEKWLISTIIQRHNYEIMQFTRFPVVVRRQKRRNVSTTYLTCIYGIICSNIYNRQT